MPHVTEDMAEEWSLKIHGLIEEEVSFTIRQLKEKFRVVTLPVTFGCAGNRRREMSVLRKPLGFSWGAAAGDDITTTEIQLFR